MKVNLGSGRKKRRVWMPLTKEKRKVSSTTVLQTSCCGCWRCNYERSKSFPNPVLHFLEPLDFIGYWPRKVAKDIQKFQILSLIMINLSVSDSLEPFDFISYWPSKQPNPSVVFIPRRWKNNSFFNGLYVKYHICLLHFTFALSCLMSSIHMISNH